MIIKTPQQGRYTWIFSSWHAPSLCSRALLLLYIAPSYLFCYTSPDLSLKIFAIAITMLRLNPTQLRLEAQDLKWHLDRLDARRAQRSRLPGNLASNQAPAATYKHADIIDPSSLPFQAVPMARSVPSSPFPSLQKFHDWSAVSDQLNRGSGFSPKLQSVSSGTPIAVTPSDESGVRSSSASIEGDHDTTNEDPDHVTKCDTAEKGTNNGPREFALPILSVSRFRPRQDCLPVDQDYKGDNEPPPTPVNHMLRKVSYQVSDSISGTSPKSPNNHYDSRIDVDGSRGYRAPLPSWTNLAHRTKSSSSNTSLNPTATPFQPKTVLSSNPRSPNYPAISSLAAEQKASISTTNTGPRPPASAWRQVDYLRRPSGTLVPSPLHISHVAISSSPSQRSGSLTDPAGLISPSSRLLSRPPRRLRGPGSSPFAMGTTAPPGITVNATYDANPAQNFSGHSDRDTRFSLERIVSQFRSTPPAEYFRTYRLERFSDHSSSSSPFTQNPSPQGYSDPPPLPRYPFHHTPRKVSNTAVMPSPSRMPSSPPRTGHRYIPYSARNVSGTISTQPSPPPNTPTAPRSAFRIYNDRLPTTSQPQTPVGLPRHGVPAELARGNHLMTAAAYTAPEERRNRSGTQLRYTRADIDGQGEGGTEGRRSQRLERWREYTSPTRMGRRVGVAEERGRLERWVDREGRENWEW